MARPASATPLQRVHIQLSAADAKLFKSLGNGQLSVGIRLAASVIQRMGDEAFEALVNVKGPAVPAPAPSSSDDDYYRIEAPKPTPPTPKLTASPRPSPGFISHEEMERRMAQGSDDFKPITSDGLTRTDLDEMRRNSHYGEPIDEKGAANTASWTLPKTKDD